jgi:putative membrane protein
MVSSAPWRRAGDLFSEEDKRAVAGAIAEAESRTSAEIIPVVATMSGDYSRAEGVVGISFALAALTVAWLVFQSASPESGDWGTGASIALGLVPVFLITLGGFVVGSISARRLALLRLAFVSKREMRYEVEKSAAAAYQRFRVSRTAGSTGVMLYVSLYERMVRVMGDGPVSEKLKQHDWNSLRDIITGGLRSRRPAEALCEAIARCGDLLALHFPLAPGDVNEMTNELRLID